MEGGCWVCPGGGCFDEGKVFVQVKVGAVVDVVADEIIQGCKEVMVVEVPACGM